MSSSSPRAGEHRGRVAAHVLCAWLLVSSAAWGTTTDESFAIPAQRADLALTQFAQQAHLSVLFPYEEVSRLKANRLEGHYSVREGVDILLKGTGLTASLESDGQLVVRVDPSSAGAGQEAKHRKGLLASFLAGMASLGSGRAPGAPDDSTLSSTAAATASALAEITVTGSRLRDTGMQTPTPVTVVTSEQMELLAPANIVESFKRLPQFLGGSDPTQNGGIGTDAGQSVLNMRGLGENRTLVLLDGRRIVPSTYNGTVDINVLPQSLLDRTEVVTGGASAAYGTDAVAGVVNFILDTNYTGLRGRVQGGITGYGDGANKEGELTLGTAIGPQAHLVASIDYYSNNPIESVRPWMQSWGAVDNPAYVPGGTQPQLLVVPHVGSSIYTPGGLIIAPGTPLNNLMFLPDGSATPFRLGSVGTQTNLQAQSGGSAYDFRRDGALNGGLESGVSRYNAFAHLSVNPADGLEVFAEALAGHNDVVSRGFPAVMFGSYQATIYADNAYLPAGIRQIMAQNNIASFGLSRLSTPADLTVDQLDQSNSTMQFTAGLKALLPEDWHFNSYLEHGRNENDLADENYPRTDRVFLAMDAVVDPATGAITCRVNLYQPGYGCVPIDLLGAGRATPQAIAYATAGTKTAYLTNTQDAFEASIDGKLFKNREQGPVAVAFGVDYRHNTLRQNVVDPTNPTNDPHSMAVPLNNPALGIQGIPPAGFAGVNSGVQFSIQANFHGVIDVKEVFGEVLLPLLKDRPFAEQLNLSLAGRWADYSGSGGIWSYKYGLDWQTLDWLRFRGTYSRDVRAADMSERFNAAGGGSTIKDPFLGNQQVVFSEIICGNPAVKPEKADTYSAGIVLQPTFAKGLSVSVDWYSIDVKDAIGMLGPQNIVNECYEGAKQLCALIKRDPVTNVITGMSDVFLNINSEKVVGTDLEADYRTSLGADRSLTVRLLGGYLAEEALSNLGAPTQQQAGTTGNLPLPRLQLNLGLNYAQGPYSVFVNERFISSGRREWNDNQPSLGGMTIDDDHIASALYTDLNLAYTLRSRGQDEFQLYLNVQNLLNRAPPRVPIYTGFDGTQDTNRALFDVLGRRFVAGFRFNFQ
jgi:iron complex outermembrane recepter protein